MLIVIIILSYFVLSLLVALLWVGIDCEFDYDEKELDKIMKLNMYHIGLKF